MVADYKNDAKVYMVLCKTTGQRYIGSTVDTVHARIRVHKSHYRMYLENKYHHRCIFDILKHNNYDIQLIEQYSCNNRGELCDREGFWINTLICINSKGKDTTSRYHKNKRKFRQMQQDNYNKKKKLN